MTNTPSTAADTGLVRLLARLFRHVSPRRRLQFAWLLALTVVGSLAEVVSLGAVVPFIAILTEPDRVFAYWVTRAVASFLGISTPAELVLPLTVAFALAGLLAGALRLLLLRMTLELTNATGNDLCIEVYRRTPYQPYRVHVARNSSEVISGITQKVGRLLEAGGGDRDARSAARDSGSEHKHGGGRPQRLGVVCAPLWRDAERTRAFAIMHVGRCGCGAGPGAGVDQTLGW